MLLLIAWDAQNLQPNMSFDAGNSEYCSTAAQTAHANMKNSGGDNWTITDGGACAICGNRWLCERHKYKPISKPSI